MFVEKNKPSLILNNTGTLEMESPTIQKLVVNRAGLIRNDIMEGRPYKVVPMIMLTEGVHKGSNGPLYYPSEELSKVPGVWNMKPVVVYHPEKNGVGISACTPDVLTSRKVGLIMNTKYEDGNLKAEAWLEEDRCDKVDPRILQHIEQEEMMELSTGVFTENEATSGEWKGKHYDGIARNYRPDHLALLPDKEGACSMEDGAGFIRNEKGLTKLQATKEFLKLIGHSKHQLSHSDLRTDLSTLLDDTLNTSDDFNTFIEDVFDNFFVYHSNAKLFKQSYNVDENDKVSFVGQPVEVVRVTEFRTLDGALVSNQLLKKENQMLKKDIVAKLIKNSKFESKDEEWLMSLNEEQLEKMLPVENEGDEESKGEEEKKKEGTATATTEAPVSTEEDTKVIPPKAEKEEMEETPAENVSQYIAKAPKAIQGMLNNGLTAYKAEKAQVIARISANQNNPYSKEALEAKELPELKNLEALCGKPASAPVANQYGINLPIAQVDNTEHVEEALVAPTLNFSK